VLGALASTAAERIGDRSAAAYSLAGLAYAQLTTNKGDEAMATATRSLAFARAAADRTEEANSLGVLAAIQYKQGDAELALASLDQAARLSRENESAFGEAIAVHNMAEVLVTLGRLAEAQQHFERSLAIRRSLADRVGEVLTMASLGRLHITLGDYAAAEKILDQALDGCRETGYREEEWRVLVCLSEVDARRANVERALAWAEEALLVAIRSDNAYGQMLSLRASARALHLLGRVPQAIAYSRRAEQILIDDRPPVDQEIEALLTGPR
jgi:tetratricopeptide (TPR) repeat protein